MAKIHAATTSTVPKGISSDRPEQVPVDIIQTTLQNALSKEVGGSKDHQPSAVPSGITFDRPESVPVEKIQSIVAEALARHEAESEEEESSEDSETVQAASAADDHQPETIPAGISFDRPESVPVEKIQDIVAEALSHQESGEEESSEDSATASAVTTAEDHQPSEIPPGITDDRPESVPVEKIQDIMAEALAKHEADSEEEESSEDSETVQAASAAEDHEPTQIPPGITADRPESLPGEKIQTIVDEALSRADSFGEGIDNAALHALGFSHVPVDIF